MYHQLSNALPSFLKIIMMTMLFKREKNHKRIGTDGDLNFEISICITTSVLVLFIFIFTKKSSVYNEYISVFYGEGVRSVCLSVTAHKNFSKLYMYVCNVYLLVQFALLIQTYTNAACTAIFNISMVQLFL